FDHLRADLRNEAAVRGATGGGQLGLQTGDVLDGGSHGVDQGAATGQEGAPAQRPVDVEAQAVLAQDVFQPGLQAFRRGLGGEAEVEVDDQLAGDDVVGAGAGVDVGHLPAGGREMVVALVPHDGGQFGQGRCGLVNGVAREVRVGDVALDALH